MSSGHQFLSTQTAVFVGFSVPKGRDQTPGIRAQVCTMSALPDGSVGFSETVLQGQPLPPLFLGGGHLCQNSLFCVWPMIPPAQGQPRVFCVVWGTAASKSAWALSVCPQRPVSCPESFVVIPVWLSSCELSLFCHLLYLVYTEDPPASYLKVFFNTCWCHRLGNHNHISLDLEPNQDLHGEGTYRLSYLQGHLLPRKGPSMTVKSTWGLWKSVPHQVLPRNADTALGFSLAKKMTAACDYNAEYWQSWELKLDCHAFVAELKGLNRSCQQ